MGMKMPAVFGHESLSSYPLGVSGDESIPWLEGFLIFSEQLGRYEEVAIYGSETVDIEDKIVEGFRNKMLPNFLDDGLANAEGMTRIGVRYGLQEMLGRNILFFTKSEDELIGIKDEKQVSLPKVLHGTCVFPL